MTREHISEFEELKGMYHYTIQKFSSDKEKLLGSMRAILETANDGADLFVFSRSKKELKISECTVEGLFEIYGEMCANSTSERMNAESKSQREKAWIRNKYSPDKPYKG